MASRKGRSPTFTMVLREVFGRALRETGQMLDRVGVRLDKFSRKETIDGPMRYHDPLSRHRQLMPLMKSGKPVISPDVSYLAPCASLVGSVYVGAGSSVFYKAVLRADNCLNSGSHFEEAINESNKLLKNKADESLPAESEDGQLVAAENEYIDDGSDMLQRIWELDEYRFAKSDTSFNGGGIFIGENTNIQDGCLISADVDHTRIGNGVTVGHLASIHSATIRDNSLIGMGSVINNGVVVNSESMIAAGAVVPKDTIVGEGELWVGNPARKLRDLTAKERAKLHFQADEYVKVATGQKHIMDLGGNLPDDYDRQLQLPAPKKQSK